MSRQNKVKKWRLALIDDQSHNPIWVLRRPKYIFISELVILILLFIAVIFSLIAYTPVRTLIPGYPDANTRRAAIQTALKVDSLQNTVARWELYSNNLLRIVEGQEPIKIDSLIKQAAAANSVSAEELTRLQQQDSILRALVAKEEEFEVSSKSTRKLTIEGMHFFTPLKGAVTRSFDPVAHPYMDINAPVNSVVMAVLDGTVISSEWSDESGFVVVLQHADDIVSIYRNNQKVLVRVGDKVAAGASIALAGGAELEFGLWYKGEAEDPSKYIKF